MKGTCTLMASVLAASTVALSSSPSSSAEDRNLAVSPYSSQSSTNCAMGKHLQGVANGCGSSLEKEKFAPRFDGLRFIETLITAHR